MEFTKKLIYKNESAIASEVNQLKTQKEYFQKIVDKFFENKINVSSDGLQKLIGNPKAYIIETLTKGETLKVGNLSLNNDKLFDLLEIPNDVKLLISDIEKVSSNQRESEFYHLKVSFFCLNNGKVEITKEHLEGIERQHSIFIENERQQSIFEILEKVSGQLNELPKYGLNTNLENDFFIIDENKKLKVNHSVFRNIN